MDDIHAQLAQAHEEIQRLRHGISRISKLQSTPLTLPPLQNPEFLATTTTTTSAIIPTTTATSLRQHTRCLVALKETKDGYIRSKPRDRKRRHSSSSVLTSSFDLIRNEQASEKILVDEIIRKRTIEIFGLTFIKNIFQNEQQLILLLLDAPNIATTRSLLKSYPELTQYSTRICIPQADPHHYSMMITMTSRAKDQKEEEEKEEEEKEDYRSQKKTASLAAAPAAAAPAAAAAASLQSSQPSQPKKRRVESTTTAADTSADSATTPPAQMMLPYPHNFLPNIRCQRLDHWLYTNANSGYECPIFFAGTFLIYYFWLSQKYF